MTEHSATIPILDPALPGHVLARAPTTAEPIASPHARDDLLNAMEAIAMKRTQRIVQPTDDPIIGSAFAGGGSMRTRRTTRRAPMGPVSR